MSKKRLLWLGYGDIAARCIPKLLAQRFEVCAVSRSEKPVPEGCDHRIGNLSNLDFVQSLLNEPADFIAVTLSPDERNAPAYKKTYLETAKQLVAACELKQNRPSQIVFVSSTSVYHQQSGEWVNENSSTQPKRETAQILLQAEHCLLDSGLPVCCLRFSGIYGDGRKHLIEQVLKGAGGDAQWTNRIHSSDCARVLAFLFELARDGQVLPTHLLASDLQPIRSSEIRAWMAQTLGLPSGHLHPTGATDTQRMNKRCDSAQLRALGYEFEFPSYREGYLAQLKAVKQQLIEQDQ